MDTQDSSGGFNLLFHGGGHTIQSPSQYSGSLEAPAGVHAPAAMRSIPTNPMMFGHSFGPESFSAMMAQQPMAVGVGRTEPLGKRKRGRPRKYADGVLGSMSLALAPIPGSMSPSKGGGRGRGRGLGKKQQLAALEQQTHSTTSEGREPRLQSDFPDFLQ
ncbi:hypothetical protein O6H91_Y475600 [Diphasiastrum complanatum]|nr:hypothetical protein O6H91_Y475600 [Diphasiastrum complanatum]